MFCIRIRNVTLEDDPDIHMYDLSFVYEIFDEYSLLHVIIIQEVM